MEKTLVARWESKSGKHYAELYRDDWGYCYKANGAGGNLGSVPEADAIASIERRVNDFQPDANKTPMRRTV